VTSFSSKRLAYLHKSIQKPWLLQQRTLLAITPLNV
jgi:hypothetical protein